MVPGVTKIAEVFTVPYINYLENPYPPRDGTPFIQNITQHSLWFQAGPSAAGGWGGFSPFNNLLKFVDFLSEKGCKSQGRKN